MENLGGNTTHFSPIDDYIGSPEHFENAKAQNQSDVATNWENLKQWATEQGPAPWDDSKWQTEPSKTESLKFNTAVNTLYNYTDRSTPDRYSQTAEKSQPSTKLLAALVTTLAPTGALVGDTILNGPSDFVIGHPEAATGVLIAIFGATALAVSKLINSQGENQ